MDSTGYVAVLVIDLHFPEAGSLKSKRKELSSIKAQLHTRLGAAVSEVAFQDLWQRGAPDRCADRRIAPGALQDAAAGVERWVLRPLARARQRADTVLSAVEDLE